LANAFCARCLRNVSNLKHQAYNHVLLVEYVVGGASVQVIYR
jgi:hypothetical protein